MLSSSSLRSDFVFSINSLILPGFPLTSFHLAEASLSTFLWLYTLVCVCVCMSVSVFVCMCVCLLFIIIYIFGTHFAINLFYLHNLKA